MISPGKHMKLQTQDIFYDYDFSQKIKIKNKKICQMGLDGIESLSEERHLAHKWESLRKAKAQNGSPKP